MHTNLLWEVAAPLAGTNTFVINITNGSVQAIQRCETNGTIESDASSLVREHLNSGQGLVKLLFPTSSGYVAQSDFLERRMINCMNIKSVKSFLKPGQWVDGLDVEVCKSMRSSDLLRHCYGAVVVEPEGKHLDTELSQAIDKELVNRLSFPWLLPDPVSKKRLGLIGGGSMLKAGGYILAAASLDVALVLFDDSSHWLATATEYREDFVPVDMTTDEALSERILSAVEKYQAECGEELLLHGLMCADEHLLSIVALIAEKLGFPTSPAKSVSMAQNKYQTRQLDPNIYCRLVRSPSEFEDLLREDGQRLESLYPLIIKPSKGWSSEGVWKVSNEVELRHRVPMLWQDGLASWHGRDVVIERFIDGPEVDANIILSDGKIVFFEASDDFPSTGDIIAGSESTATTAPVANFVETSNLFPSTLPVEELDLLQQRLHELVLAAGFRDAVLHLEARLHNSSCEYSNSNGFVDLTKKQVLGPSMKPEDIFLIEINPRAPGFQECEAIAHAYGVSYYTLSILRACADAKRIEALSKPFLHGAQYYLSMELVAAESGGIYRHGDICAAVLEQAQHLRGNIVKYANLIEAGFEVPDPASGKTYGNFLCYFLVASRKSRREAISMGRELRALVRKITDNF